MTALPFVAFAAWRVLRPGPVLDPPDAARRVAVLYFDDQSAGGRLAPVADGLTEGVIDALARVKQLRVVSPGGVEPFREHSVDADSVGGALGVGTLVRGSVDGGPGDSVRVRVRSRARRRARRWARRRRSSRARRSRTACSPPTRATRRRSRRAAR